MWAFSNHRLRFGDYRVLEPLGRGSGGQVFRAVHARSGATVAIKCLWPEQVAVPRDVARFRQEAAVLASCRSHPHLLRYLEQGEDDGVPYIITELVEGGSLASRLAQGIRPRVIDTVVLSLQVLSGLRVLHEQGIVHRDVSPSNILIHREGGAVLGDFGLACHARLAPLRDDEPPRGTMGYCAPEQRAAPHSVGPAADIYAVGALLYRLLSGVNPPDIPLSEAHVTVWRPIAPWLRPVVQRATALRPSDRYASAEDMEQAIAAARRSMTAREPTALHALPPPTTVDGASCLRTTL